MNLLMKNTLLLALMFCAATAGWLYIPKVFTADAHPAIELQQILPLRFDGWQEMKESAVQIVNPEEEEKLKALYSQQLTRSYINASGHRVMLSIAYGRDQRAYFAVHYPEVCYQAQGFLISSNSIEEIPYGETSLAVRRLETSQGKKRYEPVTYWTTIGEYRSLGGFKKRIIELSYGLNGKIPDGLVFRVSSIGQDSNEQFNIQQGFITSLLNAVAPDQRKLLIGSGGS